MNIYRELGNFKSILAGNRLNRHIMLTVHFSLMSSITECIFRSMNQPVLMSDALHLL